MTKMLPALFLFCAGFQLSAGMNSWDIPESDIDDLVYTSRELDQEWVRFKKDYNRTYVDTHEEFKRRLYWEDTLRFIQEHNLKFALGETTFTVGENDFADMAEDEFEKIYLRGLILPEVEEDYPEPLGEPDPEAPLEIDWRTRGLVSSVKNQGSCGSCWAFSAVGALEGQDKKKHGGDIKDLSEQNLVDCANYRYHNYGCRGGWMNNAFNYIRQNNGIDRESCYPYRGRDQSCQYRSSCKATSDKGAKNVGKSENSLKSELARIGPMAIAMDVNHRPFWYYKSGILNIPSCNKYRPNHAMLAVGYGNRGGDYWIIKNSWGTGWGQQGYLFAARGRGDKCGISQYASYPVL